MIWGQYYITVSVLLCGLLKFKTNTNKVRLDLSDIITHEIKV